MDKILIWGTGKVAKELLENGVQGEIIGFIESRKRQDYYMNKQIFDVDKLPENYDFIIVANTYTEEIYDSCIKNNINMERVIFLFPLRKLVGSSQQRCISRILGEKNYINYCVKRGIFNDTFFENDLELYRSLNHRKSFEAKDKELWPILTDKYAPAGTIRNYFWQDIWAARLIIRQGVKEHFDIGSRLDGFIAHLLAADIDVQMIDIRKFPGDVEHLYTIVDDATTLHQIQNESVESMSALCSLEHFGLGRYGDPIDPEACFTCFTNIQTKLKKGGHIYISVPIGRERVEFNAHRVFYASTIVDCFHDLQLLEYSCVAQDTIEYNVDIHKYDNDQNDGEYRYGLFHFIK